MYTCSFQGPNFQRKRILFGKNTILGPPAPFWLLRRQYTNCGTAITPILYTARSGTRKRSLSKHTLIFSLGVRQGLSGIHCQTSDRVHACLLGRFGPYQLLGLLKYPFYAISSDLVPNLMLLASWSALSLLRWLFLIKPRSVSLLIGICLLRSVNSNKLTLSSFFVRNVSPSPLYLWMIRSCPQGHGSGCLGLLIDFKVFLFPLVIKAKRPTKPQMKSYICPNQRVVSPNYWRPSPPRAWADL